jgi:hypothetical protein
LEMDGTDRRHIYFHFFVKTETNKKS